MKINNIMTEYLSNPIGLGILSPRIQWTLEGVKTQKSYEINYKVNGILKSSGVIESNSMHYDFKETFSSRDHIDFTITIESEEGKVTSEEHFFEMGLLDQNEFKASWISGNYKVSKSKRYPVDYFKKEFETNSISKARLYISALGLYEAHINNKRVGNFVLAPGSTDYRKRVQYQTYDVTSLLQNGNNEITIELADGWYRGCIGARGNTYIFGKESAVLVQLEIEDANGNKTVICSDDSFAWSNDGKLRFADLKDGENVDNNLVPSYKGKAKVITPKVNLQASNNTFIEEQEVFSPLRHFVSPKGKHVYEFKQNLAGIIEFKVNAHKGEEVHIMMGEMLDKEGEVTLANVQLPNKKKMTPCQEVNLICKEGLNEYHGKFTISGFRYLESNVELDELKQIALYSRIPQTISFESSNELLNIFTRNTLWSLKSNSADVPTDCPTRERMGWTGDSQVFFNSASFLTNYAPFARKHIVDVFDRQDKNGRLPQIAPYNAEDWYMDVMNGSVGWADVGVLIPYRYYLKYGDDRLLREYYDRMVSYANFMIRRTGRTKGLYSIYAKPLKLSKELKRFGVNNGQSYGEWAEPNDVCAFVWTDFCEPHPEESMAYTIYILRLMNTIGDILGRNENKERFSYYADGITKAYQELVSKGKDKRFLIDTDRQAKLVRPLYMDIYNEEQKEFAKKRLIKALENYDWKLGTGFLSTPFILDVLASYDVEAAYKLLENEQMPGWLYMAIHDTGTIWEGWEGPNAQLGISSLNHYSKGAVVEWLFHGMCGINVVSENHFELKPIIGGKETSAKASYDSIYGTIALAWKKENDKVIIDFEVPSNTTATFIYDTVNEELSSGTYHYEF